MALGQQRQMVSERLLLFFISLQANAGKSR